MQTHLLDAKAEVASSGPVALLELVFLDLEATFEDLLGLLAADGDPDGDLLVTTDRERADGVAGCFKSKHSPLAFRFLCAVPRGDPSPPLPSPLLSAGSRSYPSSTRGSGQ